MERSRISRRQFIHRTAALAGGVVLSPLVLPAGESASASVSGAKRTAVDLVTLGKTGLKLSRLGIGTGSNSGNVQRSLGREGFSRLLRHAHERGITYIDTAESYKNHDWIREAVKGLPREKLFIQTKMGGTPEKPLEVIDRFRKELGVDYIDSLLVHCACTKDWAEERKRVLDALAEAKEKKIIRAKGVSCHSISALTRSVELDWTEVHLVRVNPQGAHIDTPVDHWEAKSNDSHLPAVMEQIVAMREKGRGIIGMKICGNGDFTKPEDREKSIRFAMGCGLLDAVVIGFKSPGEVDEAIERMNRALAEKA